MACHGSRRALPSTLWRVALPHREFGLSLIRKFLPLPYPPRRAADRSLYRSSDLSWFSPPQLSSLSSRANATRTGRCRPLFGELFLREPAALSDGFDFYGHAFPGTHLHLIGHSGSTRLSA